MTGEELKQQIALYESADHTVHLDVKVDEDTVWLNRQQLALLFGRDIKTIGKHVGNALREELNGFSVVAKFATTASDGKTYQVEHYNLDMILSVGYRVKSKEGIYFRRWANSVLKQHLVDGYTINRKRLDALHAVIKVLSRSTEPESVSGSIPCQKKQSSAGLRPVRLLSWMRMRAGLTVVLSRNVDCTRCGTARGFGRFPPAVPQRSL